MTVTEISRDDRMPVSLIDARDFLRIVHDRDDWLILQLISAATDRAEQITGRALTPRVIRADFLDGERAALPLPPIVDITSVEVSGEPVDYTVSVEHGVTVVSPEVSGPLSVVYSAGYVSAPDAIRQWILVQVSTMYEQRESFSDGRVTQMPRTFVDHLLDSYRIRIA